MTAPAQRDLVVPTGLRHRLLEWAGPAGAPTLLLVHGFLDLAWSWRRCAERLAAHFRVIAPDLRGHGDTEWIGAGGYYYFADYVADLDGIAATIDGPLVVVGHSMGGSVTSYWAGVRPQRPAGVVLLEGLGPPETERPAPDVVADWIGMWARARQAPPRPMPDLAEAAARLRKHDPLLGQELADELARHGTRATAAGLVWKHDPLHLTRGPMPYRRAYAEQFWRRVACPVLVVDGGVSTFRLAEDDAAGRLACFAQVERATLPACGHMMQRHDPDGLAALIADFAARVTS